MPFTMLILGASGRTGRLLVQRALSDGNGVTALVRSGSAFSMQHPNLRVVTGDVLEPDTLPEALDGCDLVISLVAPRPRRSGNVYTEGMRNLANAAIAANVRRLIAVSAEGAGVESSTLPLGHRLVRRIPIVSRLYPAIALMESELTARDDLNWTVVRPAILTNRTATGSYRVAEGTVVPDGLSISRADLAAFLLDVAENERFIRRIVAIAN
ncbi:MAG: NAD(P)H-binding protein [Coriobacteriia bacterium]|nr:NAD(P)H-binding protein [Coriobacteriia bacterium]